MFENLEELRQECLNCTKCELHKTRTNVVFGIGNLNSEILFIGEGPGEKEDLAGEPFVGRSGQLLDKMLSSIHLDRNKNIYIGNMVKCRPPSNRDPKPDEQQACMGYLENQIKLMKPKIIVCLGRIAAQKIIGSDFKVTKDHGKWFTHDGVLMMGMFHPAAILRNQSQKPDAFQDFITLREKIKEVCTTTYDGIDFEELEKEE